MQENINILNELKEVGSTVLVTLGREDMYSVPADYFNNFPQGLLARIFVESISPVNLYTVSADYFENLPEIILEKLSIKKDFQEFSGLEKTPYSVPEGYFSNLAENILEKIKADTGKGVQEELEEIAPILSKMPKTNVYAVPAGYFTGLDPVKITTPKTSARIISIGNRGRKWANYAVAACVAAILFGGAYLYFSGSGPGNPPVVSTTAAVNVQKELSELTDTEIANYLTDDNNTAIYFQGSDDQRDLNINTLLENMSDEEIEQYLINNADPGEENGGI